MKKISDEEFSKLQSGGNRQRKTNKGKSSVFYSQILGLHVGENLFITKQEWKGYRTPARICRYIMKKFPGVKYHFIKAAGKTGWAIRRVEWDLPAGRRVFFLNAALLKHSQGLLTIDIIQNKGLWMGLKPKCCVWLLLTPPLMVGLCKNRN